MSKLNLSSTRTLLRLKSVVAKTGLGESSIYNRLNPKSRYYDPNFPKQASLTARGTRGAVAWDSDEIDAWVALRLANR